MITCEGNLTILEGNFGLKKKKSELKEKISPWQSGSTGAVDVGGAFSQKIF